jgi:oligoribonuclease NrnB/cAMP/cGMP phosphodiesterase (DHH superfamily)
MGETAKYIPVNYHEPVPELPERCALLIADFSYPRDTMEELAKKHSLVVLDHHTTAQAACQGLDFCEFDMKRSGTMMVRDFFNVLYPVNQATPPFPAGQSGVKQLTFADYIMDRDLWNWKLPDSKEFSAALASYPRDFLTWFRLSINDLCKEGRAILRYQQQLTEQICQQARPWEFLGRKGMVVSSPVLQSEVGHHLLQTYSDAVFAAIWYSKKSGEYTYSLRSRSSDECNVSEMAAQFPEGGGHPCAAGFTVPSQFDVGSESVDVP